MKVEDMQSRAPTQILKQDLAGAEELALQHMKAFIGHAAKQDTDDDPA